MDLDEETLSLLGGRHEDAIFNAQVRLAEYLERRQVGRLSAKAEYEASAKGRKTRAAYNALYSTRPKRKQRRNRVRVQKPRSEPVLRGYARIKAWRDANPAKARKIEKRYLSSEKGKTMKSKKNKKHYAKYHDRELARVQATRAQRAA